MLFSKTIFPNESQNDEAWTHTKEGKEEGAFEVKLSSLTESQFAVSIYCLGSKELTNMQTDNVECHPFVHMLFI